jgi:Tfp pilus assembly protein PilF
MFMPSGRVAAPSINRQLFLCALCAALLLLMPVEAVRAQSGMDFTGTNGRHTIKGHLYFPSGRSVDSRVNIKLESSNTSNLSVMTDSNGGFTFAGLSPGYYTVVIETDDYETAREAVFIDTEARTRRTAVPTIPRVYTLTIHLQPKRERRNKNEKTGVVNAALVNVPQAARELYEKAQRAAEQGDTRKAIELLKNALAYHSDFALALNDLGVNYLKTREPAKAAEALRQALKLAPENFTVLLNYGIALLNLKQFAEAETHLRLALKQKDNAPTAHMYLGIALVNLQNFEEAQRELERAIAIGGATLGPVHYYLGGIYWRKKEYKRAADALEKYLQLEPNAPDATRIRATIKEFRNRPQA